LAARAARNRLAPKVLIMSKRPQLAAFVDRHFLILSSWPSLLVMLAVTLIPFAATIGLSFTNYDLVRSQGWQFIGLGNFVDLVHDKDTPQIVFNTAYLVIATTTLETLFGLGLAVLMDSSITGVGLIRTAYILPIMTAPIVVALTWRAMFNDEAGWINYFLGLAHLPQPTWLGDPLLAMPAVILADMWTGVSFQAVLLLAGLLSVPRELKEAAESDGANAWQVFWNVTLPSIQPVLFVAVVLRMIDAFRKFEGIQILTTGGPGNASTPINLQIYNTGLFYHQVGYAAAYGVVMILMIAASVGLLYLAFGRSS
jgi:multiple sugar transport system permease protein